MMVRTEPPRLVDRMRANATLLDMMATGELPIRRADLRGLVTDIRAWAREIEIASSIEPQKGKAA